VIVLLIQGKTNGLTSSLHYQLPHVLCLTKHHLNYNDLASTYIEYYNYSAAYCRKNFKLGGSCTFIHENLKFIDVKLSDFCKEKDLEAWPIKLPFLHGNISVLSLYRAPSGNFAYFLKGLEAILNSLYDAKLELIICGDININYKGKSISKLQMDIELKQEY
jgi:exonuclease III